MQRSPTQEILDTFKRSGNCVLREIILPLEFINKAFDAFAYIDRVYPEIVAELWEAVPEPAREEFTEAIRNAICSDFRYKPFSESRASTEEELRRPPTSNTRRVQAWAAEFDRFLAADRQGGTVKPE